MRFSVNASSKNGVWRLFSDIYCLYFMPRVMVKVMRKVTGTLRGAYSVVYMRLIECNLAWSGLSKHASQIH